MSTKLNAEELAAKMYSLHDMLTDKEKENIQLDRNVCIETIRKVAQPIADERDELREALEEVMAYREGRKPYDFYHLQSESDRDNAAFDAWTNIEQKIRATLAKYPKP